MGAFDEFDKEYAGKAPVATKDANPFDEFDAEMAPKPERGIVGKAVDAVGGFVGDVASNVYHGSIEPFKTQESVMKGMDGKVSDKPMPQDVAGVGTDALKDYAQVKAPLENVFAAKRELRKELAFTVGRRASSLKEFDSTSEGQKAARKTMQAQDDSMLEMLGAKNPIGQDSLVDYVANIRNLSLTLQPTTDQLTARQEFRDKYGYNNTASNIATALGDVPQRIIPNVARQINGDGDNQTLKDIAGSNRLLDAQRKASGLGDSISLSTSMASTAPMLLLGNAPGALTKVGAVAVSYLGMTRESESRFMDDVRAKLDNESIAKRGHTITADEWNKQKQVYDGIKSAYGNAEGIGEALGAAATLAAIPKLSGNVGTMITALGQMMVGELGGETLTQQMQQPLESMAGLSDEQKRSMFSGKDWIQSFKEVAPDTITQTLITGGLAKAVQSNSGRNLSQKEKIFEEMRAANALNQTTADLNTPSTTNVQPTTNNPATAPTQSNNVSDADLLASVQQHTQDAPTPEPKETLQAQVTALNAGNKPAILLTPGEAMPEGLANDIKTADIPGRGTLLYKDDATLQQALNGELGQALGYGINEKPTDTNQTITARDANGTVIQDVLTDGSQQVLDAAQQVAGNTGTVEQRSAEEAINERNNATDPRLPQFNEALAGLNAIMASPDALKPIKSAFGYDTAYDFQKAVTTAQNTALPLQERIDALKVTRDILSQLALKPQQQVTNTSTADRPFSTATDDFLPKMRSMTTDEGIKAQIDTELALRGIASPEISRAKDVASNTGRVLQNRDRSSPNSIAQMQAIAAKPDFLRAGISSDMSIGAPVVFANEDVIPSNAILGDADVTVDGKGNRYDTQYAVIEAGSLIASNNVDGTSNAEYQNGNADKLRTVAGNGRTAGIQRGYEQGTAGQYNTDLTDKVKRVGIDAASISGIKNPVLVRIMKQAQITDDIGDLSNITQTAQLSPVEQAKTDATRAGFDLANIDFNDDGNVTSESVKRWVQSLPQTEQSGLTSNGQVSMQAITRFNSAMFNKAYGDDSLVQLYAEATDQEVKNIINAVGATAPLYAQLAGAGDYDIRGAIVEATQIAVNAKRKGEKLNDYLKTVGIGQSDEAVMVAQMFADNVRSQSKIVESLRNLAQSAIEAYDVIAQNDTQGGFFAPAIVRTRAELFRDKWGATKQTNEESANDNTNQTNTTNKRDQQPTSTANERVDEGQAAIAPSRDNQAENGAQRVEETASPEIKAIVEAIVKRRAAANELGKIKAFDNYLAEAKKLLAGKQASVTKFRLAAASFKADPLLTNAFTQLANIASPQAKADRQAKASNIDAYKQRIAEAKTVADITAIQAELSKDNSISDSQLEKLDDMAIEAMDSLDAPKQAAENDFNLAGQTNEDIAAAEAAKRADEAKEQAAIAKEKSDNDAKGLADQVKKNAGERGFVFGEAKKDMVKAISSGVDDMFADPAPAEVADKKTLARKIQDKIEAAQSSQELDSIYNEFIRGASAEINDSDFKALNQIMDIQHDKIKSALPENSRGTHFAAGQQAFKNGANRTLPDYFTNSRTENAKNWYRGYDQASIDAPIAESIPQSDYEITEIKQGALVTIKGSDQQHTVRNTYTLGELKAGNRINLRTEAMIGKVFSSEVSEIETVNGEKYTPSNFSDPIAKAVDRLVASETKAPKSPIQELKQLRQELSAKIQAQGTVTNARDEDRLKQVNAALSEAEQAEADAHNIEATNRDNERFEIELRSIAKSKEEAGDALYSNGRFVNFADAVRITKQAIKEGITRPFPAQLHLSLGFAMRDVDRILSAVNAEEAPKQADNKQFANNKVFTADKVAAARARLKAKLGTLNSGIDPELMADGLMLAGAYIESGIRTYSAYAKAMIADLGIAVTPYLHSFYESVRVYPGIDTAGMTSYDETAKAHAALLTPAVKAEVSLVIGNGVIEAPKVKAKPDGQMTLTQDWGVDDINGYDSDRDDGQGGVVKTQFLAEAKKYLNQVAKLLEAQGYTPHVDSRGRATKAVSVNEGGQAGSGEVRLTMLKGDVGIYVDLGTSAIRGLTGNHPQAVSVMARVTGKAKTDRFANSGQNNWFRTDLNATSLAEKMINLVALLPSTNTPNIQVSDKNNEGVSNASTLQAEQLPNTNPQSDNVAEQSGDSDSQSLDAGLAKKGRKATGRESVPDLFDRASGNGTSSTGGNAEYGSSSAARENADAGNQPSATDDLGNYEITADDNIGKGGLSQKYRDNVTAIKIIKTLDAENRVATPDERKLLAKYAGFGALQGVFDRETKTLSKEYAELKALLTDEEYRAASASVLNAYFTSPVIVKSMYAGLERLGFTGGRVLEPSLGSGNFFGMMPANLRNKSNLNGVELDVLTSKLAKYLYPKAKIATATGFEEYDAPNGYFDMVISNPPFGSEPLRDLHRTPYSGFSIHNYFIAKSIDKLRDGGILAVVVSNSFMDLNNSPARRWIAQRANLIGAVRLPNEAFKENAGTEVITDILYFQKTANPSQNQLWANTSNVSVTNPKTGDAANFEVNQHFVYNPANILGKQSAKNTQFGNSYTVESNGNVEKQLAEFVEKLPQNIYIEPTQRIAVLDAADNVVPDGVKVGTFYKEGSTIRQRITDMMGARRSVVWESPNSKAGERMGAMMDIRDTLRKQMRLERDGMSTVKDIENNRKELNRRYDKFLKDYGYLNSQINRRLFNDDTESSLLQALEFEYDKGTTKARALVTGFDEKPASATKAAIFKRRVLFPPADNIIVTNAKDALLDSLNTRGRVDMAAMQESYNKSESEIIAELGDILFSDPNHGYVTADEYLSGDVKTKLAEAIAAAKTDDNFARNVDELKKVIPADKMPSQIYSSLGVNWVPAKIYADFAASITGAPSDSHDFAYIGAAAVWVADMRGTGDIGQMTADYGTGKLNAFELIKLAINGKAAHVTMQGFNREGFPARVTDPKETDAANAKLLKIKEAWASWVWADPDRADVLATIYNEKHNRIIERKFDGSHMSFPGMVPSIGDRVPTAQGVLLPHQKSAVWRGIQDRNVLLDHAVGAGKTFVGAAIGMEMKRLGIARKMVYVVPNHLTLQWRSEFNLLYPGANVLAATPEDFAKDKRERLFSKMITGEYDAIIIGHSSLTKIGLPADVEQRLYQQQADEIADAIEELKRDRGDRGIVRDMEKIKKGIDDKITLLVSKAGTKDNVVTFDELGIDGLFIDEMHEFKNLFFTTQMQRTAGLGNPAGSGKAFDLFMKVKWMQETYGENAPLITATGTPVSNSLAEMFTMQRYMKYEQLKRDGFHLFDAWAKQFAEVEQVTGIAPSGVGYKQSTRFTKFKNLPALMSSYKSFADVVTLQNLKDSGAARGEAFPVPKMKGGSAINIVAKRSEAQSAYFGVPKLATDDTGAITFALDPATAKIEESKDGKFILSTGNDSSSFDTKEDAELSLVSKALTPNTFIEPGTLLDQFANLAELTRETEGKINALSLTGLANKAGLDLRIIDPNAKDFAGSKVNIAVGNMVSTYQQWDKDKGAQLVFLDSSIPASARASMATKEKRVYVRDDKNLLTHKTKGVIYSKEGFEGYPFYVVKEKDGFDTYEAATGKKITQRRFADKDAAKAWVDSFVGTEDGRSKIWELRDTLAIDQDDITEYRDNNNIEAEDDLSDEVGIADLEALTGSAKFSVYDDIKAKLIKQGIPAHEIAFIHDYNTPKAKEGLFKQVNAGQIRILLGSTAKLGAGTNVQQRLVGLHHIDAPWRPSDLEQREGRIIRQGNKLYERDPEGFEVGIWRYATEQTYDTRRWQLLEYKALGIEQLRNYSGETEIDDIASEAANSADMKAAASGNPLVLEETKLAAEVKRLKTLETAHSDSLYAMGRKIKSNENEINVIYPMRINLLKAEIAITNKYPLPTDTKRVADISVDGNKSNVKEVAEAAIKDLAEKVRASYDIGITRSIRYRGIEFALTRGTPQNSVKLSSPAGSMHLYGSLDAVSPSGLITRMNNEIDAFDQRIALYEAWTNEAKVENESLRPRLTATFELADKLKETQLKYSNVVRKLAKSNQLEAVPADQIDRFKKLLEERKAQLKSLGYGKALSENDAVNDEMPMFSRGNNANSLPKQTVQKAVDNLRANWANAPEIIVVDDMNDPAIRKAVRDENDKQLSQGAQGQPEGFFDAGKVYILASEMNSASDVIRVVMHETLGHYGLRGVFGKKLGAILKTISMTRHKEMVAKATQYGKDLSIEADRNVVAEEILAEMAQNAPGANLVQRAIAAIRQFLRDIGVKLELTDNDIIVNYLLPARNFVVNSKGKVQSYGNPTVAFSRSNPQLNSLSVIPAETRPEAAQRKIQDKFNRFKVLQEWVKRQGVDLSEAADVYLHETLMSGRVATRKEDFRDNQMAPLIQKTQNNGFTMDQVGDFLKVQHAPEANKRAREIQGDVDATAYGVSDNDAKTAMDDFKSLPNFAALKSIANQWRDITNQTKQIKLDSGLLPPEMVKVWEDAYQVYVPVKGEDDANKVIGNGQGLNVNGKNKQRLGHGLRDEAIIENILRDHEAAITLDEKNRVGKSFLKFLMEANNAEIGTISKPVKRKILKQGDTAYVITYKGADVASADTMAEAKMHIMAEAALGKTASDFVIVKTTDPVRVMLQASPMLAENEVNVYVGGHAIRLQINDAILAQEYKNMGVEHLNTILAAGRGVNNWLSKVYTGYSPDFIFTNPLRDATQGFITLTGNHGAGMAAKIFSNYPHAVKELVKHFKHNGSSSLVSEYRANGGSTGGSYLSDLERIGNDVQSSYDEYAGAKATYKRVYDEAIANGRSKKIAHTVASLKAGASGFKKVPAIGHFAKLMEHLNAVTENALRVATYKTLVDSGMSNKRAAAQAKDLMNFNRKGEISNQVGAMFLFFNPSVQGSKLIHEALFKSPHKRQAQALAGSMVLGAMAVAALAMSGDDDDKDKWNKIPDHVKDGNIVIRIFGLNLTLTLPYGYRMFWTLGNVLSDAMQGKDTMKLAIRMASSVFANLSPVGNPVDDKGNANLFQVLPTVPKMLIASKVNENSFGQAITPTRFSKSMPDSELMNRGTHGTLYDGITSSLNAMSGGSKYEAGLVDVSPETLKFWVKSLTGGTGQFALDAINMSIQGAQGVAPKEFKNVPVIRRFVHDGGISDTRSAFWDRKNEADLAAEQLSKARKAHDVDAVMDLSNRNGVLASMAKSSDTMLKMANARRNASASISADKSLSLADRVIKIKELEDQEAMIYDRYIKLYDARVKAN